MSLKQRLKKLEQIAGQPEAVDLVAAIHAHRDAHRLARHTGMPVARIPTPPEWEHSRNPIARRLFDARRRVGRG